jgi:histidinol-phosphate aminotransferase
VSARRRGRYSQFEGLSEEEVNAGLREAAAERRRRALARVEPLHLDHTTWPELPPHVVVNAVTFAARRGLHRYVDRGSTELRAALAAGLGVPAGRVVVGAGAAQLLAAAAAALLEPGDELVTPWPSYPLAPLMARRAHGAAVPVAGAPVPEAVLRAVTDRTRVVYLCNPNDPTGELLPLAELDALLGALPERVVVLLDEALRDFVDAEPVGATLALLERHPRLLIFRTFSKAWGLAGLRVGLALGGPEAGPLLEQLVPDLGVDELAQAGAVEALRSIGPVVQRRRATIAAHRRELADALGDDAPPSQANVLWVPAGRVALERHAIHAAPGAPYGAPDRIRLTVPHTAAGLERLLRAVADGR